MFCCFVDLWILKSRRGLWPHNDLEAVILSLPSVRRTSKVPCTHQILNQCNCQQDKSTNPLILSHFEGVVDYETSTSFCKACDRLKYPNPFYLYLLFSRLDFLASCRRHMNTSLLCITMSRSDHLHNTSHHQQIEFAIHSLVAKVAISLVGRVLWQHEWNVVQLSQHTLNKRHLNDSFTRQLRFLSSEA